LQAWKKMQIDDHVQVFLTNGQWVGPGRITGFPNETSVMMTVATPQPGRPAVPVTAPRTWVTPMIGSRRWRVILGTPTAAELLPAAKMSDIEKLAVLAEKHQSQGVPADWQEHDDRLRLCNGFRSGQDPAHDKNLERRVGHEGTRLALTHASQP
jgi:hypothetical protein